MRIIPIGLLIFLSGCFSSPAWYDNYAFPAITENEKIAVGEVEKILPLAAEKFERPYFKNPILCIVRTPDQYMPEFGCTWRALPTKRGVPERVPGEGYSGLWSPPVVYVSTIGDRATLASFHLLYCHERAHTFGVGDGDSLLIVIENYLYNESLK